MDTQLLIHVEMDEMDEMPHAVLASLSLLSLQHHFTICLFF